MNKKKVVILLFGIFVILLVVLVAGLNYFKTKEVEQVEIETNEQIKKQSIETYSQDKVLPRGVSTLYGAYKGSNDKNDLYRNLKELVNYLPNLCTDIKIVNDNNLKIYYEKHKDEIFKKLGISDLEDFITFTQYIKTINLEKGTYNSSEIDDTTYENVENYLTFNLQLVYENVEENVNIKVYFANNKSVQPQIRYSVID